MRLIAILFMGLGFCLCAFGVWGFYTPDGRARFDEMDGLYPMFAGAIGIVALVIGSILWGVTMWRNRSR